MGRYTFRAPSRGVSHLALGAGLAFALALLAGCGLSEAGSCDTCTDATATDSTVVDGGIMLDGGRDSSSAPPDSTTLDSFGPESATGAMESGVTMLDTGLGGETGPPGCASALNCPAGQACDMTSGLCVSTCGTSKLCNGCCDTGQNTGNCQAGTSNTECGVAGGRCAPCTAPEQCAAVAQGGQCSAACTGTGMGSCGAGACCVGGLCVSATQPTACGLPSCTDCAMMNKVCSSLGTCVPCGFGNPCGGGECCQAGQCVSASVGNAQCQKCLGDGTCGCSDNAGCSEPTPVCFSAAGLCVQCLTSADCTSGGNPYCFNFACVQCDGPTSQAECPMGQSCLVESCSKMCGGLSETGIFHPCNTGCCSDVNNGMCQPGMAPTACGSTGDVCTSCAAGTMCDGTSCVMIDAGGADSGKDSGPGMDACPAAGGAGTGGACCQSSDCLSGNCTGANKCGPPQCGPTCPAGNFCDNGAPGNGECCSNVCTNNRCAAGAPMTPQGGACCNDSDCCSGSCRSGTCAATDTGPCCGNSDCSDGHHCMNIQSGVGMCG